MNGEEQMDGMTFWWKNFATWLSSEPPCSCCGDLRERLERHEDFDDKIDIHELYEAFVARRRAAGAEVLVSAHEHLGYALYKYLMRCDEVPFVSVLTGPTSQSWRAAVGPSSPDRREPPRGPGQARIVGSDS